MKLALEFLAAGIGNQRGVILDVNAAFTEITGYSRAEAVGRTPRLLRSDRRTGRCRAVPALTCSPDGGLEPGAGWSRLSELAHP